MTHWPRTGTSRGVSAQISSFTLSLDLTYCTRWLTGGGGETRGPSEPFPPFMTSVWTRSVYEGEEQFSHHEGGIGCFGNIARRAVKRPQAIFIGRRESYSLGVFWNSERETINICPVNEHFDYVDQSASNLLSESKIKSMLDDRFGAHFQILLYTRTFCTLSCESRSLPVSFRDRLSRNLRQGWQATYAEK